MKISKTSTFEENNIPEKLIFRSIEKYVSDSKYPTGSIMSSVRIKEGKIEKNLNNVNDVIKKGTKVKGTLETENFTLRRDCLILLEDLRNSIE